MVYRLSHMLENERTLSSSFYEVSNNQFQNQIKTTKKITDKSCWWTDTKLLDIVFTKSNPEHIIINHDQADFIQEMRIYL